MELVKNIFFNTDRLTANSVVKISYIGKFFQDNSKDVTLRYTFEDDWSNCLDVDMIKTELGFQAEIELQDKDTFGFCFKNENNEWDSNDGNNYTFNIEHPETALLVVDNLEGRTFKTSSKILYLVKKNQACYL